MSEATPPYSPIQARKRAFWFGFFCFGLAFIVSAFAVSYDSYAPLWTHLVLWGFVALLYLAGALGVTSGMSGRGMRWIARAKPDPRLQRLTRWIGIPVAIFCVLALTLPSVQTTIGASSPDTAPSIPPLALLAAVPILMAAVFLSFRAFIKAPLSAAQKRWRFRITCLSMPIFVFATYAVFLAVYV